MRFFARRATRFGSPDAIASMSSTRRAALNSFDDSLGRLMTEARSSTSDLDGPAVVRAADLNLQVERAACVVMLDALILYTKLAHALVLK